jgi:hypothetical protein
MQSTIEGLISNMISVFDRSLWAIQWWVRQEIVDDDPCDVETLFPNSNDQNHSEK